MRYQSMWPWACDPLVLRPLFVWFQSCNPPLSNPPDRPIVLIYACQCSRMGLGMVEWAAGPRIFRPKISCENTSRANTSRVSTSRANTSRANTSQVGFVMVNSKTTKETQRKADLCTWQCSCSRTPTTFRMTKCCVCANQPRSPPLLLIGKRSILTGSLSALSLQEQQLCFFGPEKIIFSDSNDFCQKTREK